MERAFRKSIVSSAPGSIGSALQALVMTYNTISTVFMWFGELYTSGNCYLIFGGWTLSKPLFGNSNSKLVIKTTSKFL